MTLRSTSIILLSIVRVLSCLSLRCIRGPLVLIPQAHPGHLTSALDKPSYIHCLFSWAARKNPSWIWNQYHPNSLSCLSLSPVTTQQSFYVSDQLSLLLFIIASCPPWWLPFSPHRHLQAPRYEGLQVPLLFFAHVVGCFTVTNFSPSLEEEVFHFPLWSSRLISLQIFWSRPLQIPPLGYYTVRYSESRIFNVSLHWITIVEAINMLSCFSLK